jgi:O-methyltransferase
MSDLIEKVLSSNVILPNQMVEVEHIRIILGSLEAVLDLSGDAVELGCFEGTTSLFLVRFLKLCRSLKHLHVYDSFQGLPEKGVEDGNNQNFIKGSCLTSRFNFERNFSEAELPLPEIHEGWFRDIKKEMIPNIAFAFLDSDFYTSILDSLVLVYPKLVPKARVVIHDYGNPALPGVAKACSEFLVGKPEKILGAGCEGLGLLIKA